MSAPRRAAGLSDAAERAGLALMRRADPETAHGLALRALNLRHAAGLSPERGPVTGPGLARRLEEEGYAWLEDGGIAEMANAL